MVRLTRITTGTGDDGTTALGDGTRVPKHALRIRALGEVDEANAALGLVRCEVSGDVDGELAAIQNDLFDLGADLCLPGGRDGALRIGTAQVQRLEQQQAKMNAGLAPLESFILPGGSRAAAQLHLVRTVARRVERTMVELATAEPVNPLALQYINRLSDFLFVLARYVNAQGSGDVLWVPGQNR